MSTLLHTPVFAGKKPTYPLELNFNSALLGDSTAFVPFTEGAGNHYRELGRRFEVTPFSGLPPWTTGDGMVGISCGTTDGSVKLETPVNITGLPFTPTGNFTAFARIRPFTTPTQYGAVVRSTSHSGAGWFVSFSTASKLEGWIYDGGWKTSAHATAYTANEDIDIALIYDGTNGIVRMDSTASATWAVGTPAYLTNTDDAQIGNYAGNDFNGIIYYAGVTNIAWTEEQWESWRRDPWQITRPAVPALSWVLDASGGVVRSMANYGGIAGKGGIAGQHGGLAG